MQTNNNEQATIDCLKHALEDTQETIRGYDNKAEILAVLLTLAVGLTNFTLFPLIVDSLEKYLLMASWVTAFAAITLLGLVLHPKVNLFEAIQKGTYTPQGTYFLHKINESPTNTISALAERALNTNWVEELTYECMKVSIIREKKHCWFVSALLISGLTLLLILLALLSGAYCGQHSS